MRPSMTLSVPRARPWTRFCSCAGGSAGSAAIIACLAVSLFASVAFGGKPAAPRDLEAEFGADVELAPYVVRGEQLAVSIHARSARDRKYAEAFSGEVMKVVHEGVTPCTGKGLVIIGAKGEPHPVAVFRRFQELAASGQLRPELAARAGELKESLDAWKRSFDDGEGDSFEAESAAVDLEFDRILNALPLPLEGVGAKLYQIAWAERFDDARLEARFKSLGADDLQRDVFARFDWVFYLPARGALEGVISDMLDQAIKEEDMGFLGRMAVRTALTVVKPMIRRAIEGVRKGMFFAAVVRAQTDYTDEQVSVLAGAYIETMVPDSDSGRPRRQGSAHERAVAAVREVAEEFDVATRAADLGAEADGDEGVSETATPAAAAAGTSATSQTRRSSGA